MADLLLLGAGFSRNWGGWLATEAFEYLLGCPEVASSGDLRRLLWKHQGQGGFEAALEELQGNYARGGSNATLMALQAAVGRMFSDMNAAFMSTSDWQFGQQQMKRQISTFLTRFDKIFTLNQDLLLEHHYVNDNISLTGKKGWTGAVLPGMKRLPPSEPLNNKSWSHSSWVPMDKADFRLEPNFQPIFKLHGSSNWTRGGGDPLLIIGGAKAQAIEQDSILSWYATEFQNALLVPGAQLMVIGYGFRDEHINAAVAKAVERGLKLFIIAPEGAELARGLNPTRKGCHIGGGPTSLEETIEESLIGASRRGLREIFGQDDVEFNKVMRFFASRPGS